MTSKFFALFRSNSPTDMHFISIHTGLEDAMKAANEQVERGKRISKFMIDMKESSYLVIEVPVVYVTQFKKEE